MTELHAPRALVSVMITVYNGARYLSEAIESVLAQTYPSVELIVADDGSTDGSGDVAKRYGGALTYLPNDHVGMAAARNRAVDLARGDYFAFLDADDRFTSDKLERQMNAFADDPELDVVFGHVTEFVSPDVDPEASLRLRAPRTNVAWRTPNLMLIKRDSFFRVGPFSTSLRVAIGLDWFARATEIGLKSHVPPIIVLERRLHAENNGIRQRDSVLQYVQVVGRSINRRRDLPRS